jgi:hypothetical protein
MEKINGAHNTDSFILLEPQEIEVARNDEVCLSSESTGENVVIIRVFLDDIRDGSGDNDFPCFVQKSDMQTHPLLVPVKISPTNTGKLFDNYRRKEKFIVVLKCMKPYLGN